MKQASSNFSLDKARGKGYNSAVGHAGPVSGTLQPLAAPQPVIDASELRAGGVSLSEQRCRKAFLGWNNTRSAKRLRATHPESAAIIDAIAWNTWQACWRYLQEQAYREFIEK